MPGFNLLKTQNGQRALRYTRSTERVLFSVDQQPKTKKSIRQAEKLDFQNRVLEAMNRRRAFRSPIVLEFDFHSKQPNPPSIHQLAKNYLDLLWHREPALGTRREALLFKDDRQVKGLFVHCHLEHVDQPSIWVRAEPLRNVVADLDLLQRIRDDDFDTDSRWSWRGRPWREFEAELHKEDEEGRSEGLVEQVRDWDRLPMEQRRRLGPAFDANRRMLMQQLQKHVLARTDRFVRSLLTRVPQLWGGMRRRLNPWEEYRARLAELSQGFLLVPGISISLGRAPARDGETTLFKSNAKRILAGYRTARPDLFPLLAQVSLTIFFTPPATGGIDLDNLARYIIPIVHEVMEPPSTYWGTVDPSNPPKDEKLRKWFEEGLASVRRLPKYSLTSYQAIELPRFPSYPPEGQIHIAFGDGSSVRSVLRDVDQVIEKRLRDL